MVSELNVPIIKFESKNDSFYLGCIKSSDLVLLSYVARRGQDDEEGAVQRILNKRRISGIRDFLLEGGFFPNSIILNFVKKTNLVLSEDYTSVKILCEQRIAQIIDGQHRIEGLREAIKEDRTIGEMYIPIVFAIDLTTEKCAEIFLSINTEQKAVPKSLIYDLYGLMNISNKDFSIERGTDIAKIVNDEPRSPYQNYIRYPGGRIFKGGIQLSSFVSNMRPLVKTDGEFSKFSLTSLDTQANVIINYFNAIKSYYGKEWDSLKNPFIFTSGFGAAIDLLASKVLPYCYSRKKFTESFFKEIIVIPNRSLILQESVKNLSGEAARLAIKEKLLECITITEATEDEYEI